MTEPVRIGLVGYGSGGRYFHAPLLASAAMCQFIGVVTRSAERRAQVAADHPAAAMFDSLESLAAAGAEAVAISTPADTHSQITDAALDLGLHVVCDKPFALDAAAASRSVERAAERGLALSPYQNRRWDSDFLTVRSLVDSGCLGDIVRFESRFERFDPDREPSAAGGGTLLDFASHLVDQALVLLGPVHTVYAEWTTRANGLDDDIFVALAHESGARSHLWGNWRQPAPGLRFKVVGTEAAYVVDGPMDGQEPALVAGESPASLGDRWGMEPPERWGRVVQGDTHEVVPTVAGAWQTFYPAFAAAVRGEGEIPVPPADAVETARVLDAARQSAITGTVTHP
jgi:predicted dehydrogenase